MLRKLYNDKLSLKKYKTFGKSRSVRLREFDYSLPYAYFAQEVTDCLLELKSKTKILTYCLMPDHLHLLLTPGENQASVPKFMQIFKGKTTHIFWKCGFKGRLWQKSYYDHIMRSSEDVHETAKYILNNPVRKNMVTEISEYPFSGIADELPMV